MENNQKTIIDFICRELEKVLPEASGLNADTDMTTDIAVDSVLVMELVFELEEKFDVSIPLNSLADIRKIKELAELVEGLTG